MASQKTSLGNIPGDVINKDILNLLSSSERASFYLATRLGNLKYIKEKESNARNYILKNTKVNLYKRKFTGEACESELVFVIQFHKSYTAEYLVDLSRELYTDLDSKNMIMISENTISSDYKPTFIEPTIFIAMLKTFQKQIYLSDSNKLFFEKLTQNEQFALLQELSDFINLTLQEIEPPFIASPKYGGKPSKHVKKKK